MLTCISLEWFLWDFHGCFFFLYIYFLFSLFSAPWLSLLLLPSQCWYIFTCLRFYAGYTCNASSHLLLKHKNLLLIIAFVSIYLIIMIILFLPEYLIFFFFLISFLNTVRRITLCHLFQMLFPSIWMPKEQLMSGVDCRRFGLVMLLWETDDGLMIIFNDDLHSIVTFFHEFIGSLFHLRMSGVRHNSACLNLCHGSSSEEIFYLDLT